MLLQDEVLGNVKDTEWSVLIMDTTTTPVMSSVCRISEILDYGVSCKPSVLIHQPCSALSSCPVQLPPLNTNVPALPEEAVHSLGQAFSVIAQ